VSQHKTPNIKTESFCIQRWQRKMQQGGGGQTNDRGKNLTATIFIMLPTRFFNCQDIKVEIVNLV
jgi:hypothetical protein